MRAASERARKELEERYLVEMGDLDPRVFYRLTDNWLELAPRFLVREHGIRKVKDAISRDVLEQFDEPGLGIASATYERAMMRTAKISHRACDRL